MSDGISLLGLPASGKTTIGRRVAERLGKPFIDIDDEVERISGRKPADIIVRDGEPALRAVEREAVGSAVRNVGAVIATGGGTVLDPLNRWLLLEHGVRVRIAPPLDVLVERIRTDLVHRPLLGSDVEEGLRRSADERAPFYVADVSLRANDDLEGMAERVIKASQTDAVNDWRVLLEGRYARHHPVGPEIASVVTGRGITPHRLAEEIALATQASGTPVVVADGLVLEANPSLAAALPPERRCDLDAGERTKTTARLEQILTWLNSMNVERTDPLVAVGGGTLGDVAGLAAAMYRRGIPLVNVPTTWLAQADSALGGKVAVDLPGAKNAVGAVWPAWLTLIDADVTRTLPIERRRDGIAECLKAGLIGDPLLWALVEQRGGGALDGSDPAAAYAITERAARVKLEIVDRDPYETGERRKLNLGHTLGHALEIESGYTLAHGAAVALGLRAVARIANRRGAEGDLAERIDAVLAQLGFDLTCTFDRTAVRAATMSDKKRIGGKQRWILPMSVGEVVEVSDVTDAELDDALTAIAV